MTTSLVTGGAGFLGAHVTNDLVRMGHDVVVLDDLTGGFEENVHSQATFVRGSITDLELIERLYRQHRFDYVYHLAAYAAEGLSHFIRRFNYENNLIGSVNLINASIKHQVECFVFTSSIAVYGALDPPMREDQYPHPEDPYGVAKLAVELDLRCAYDMFGLDYVVFRPHNVYGEYQNLGDRYRNVVGIFMKQLMEGAPLTIFGDGTQTRAFSYVGDISPHIANSVNVPEARGEVFNVGADQECTVNQLAESVMEALGIRGELRHLDARNEVMNAFADHSKARQVFDIQADTSLIDGLSKMATWARQAGIRKSAKFQNLELTENLPPIWTEN